MPRSAMRRMAPFAYHGCVRNPDGTDFRKNITFDPAVINDGSTIGLYYGWSLDFLPEGAESGKELLQIEMTLSGMSEEEIKASPEGIMGAYTIELEEDMLTVKGNPVRIVPGLPDATGTSFEGHAFFEAGSIRKIRGQVLLYLFLAVAA